MSMNLSRLVVRAITLSAIFLLIVVALLVSTGRVLVTNSALYKEDIEKRLSQQLGIPVTVGTLEGRWTHLNPELLLSDVALGDAATPVVSIGSAQMEVSWIRSLLRRNLIATDIEILTLGLAVEESTPGDWHVVGLKGNGGGGGLDLVLDSLPYLDLVEIRGLSVDLKGLRGTHQLQEIEDESIKLVSRAGERTFRIPLQITSSDDEDHLITLTGTYQGDIRTPNYSGEFYFEATHLQISDFVALPENEWIRGLSISGKAWAEFNDDETRVRSLISTDVDVNGTRVKASLTGALFAREDKITLTGKNLALSYGELSVGLPTVGIVVDQSLQEMRRFGATLGTVDIGEVVALIRKFDESQDVLPDGLMAALAEIRPVGELESLYLTGDTGNLKDSLKATGRLKGAGLSPYLGSPGLTILDGAISVGAATGHIDINNAAFEMHFANLFEQSWPFDSARGRLSYWFDGSTLRVSSGLVELIDGDLSAYGKVNVNIGETRENNTWGLVLGITDGELLDSYRYLPKTLSPELLEWIGDSVTEGSVLESGLIFHGALARAAPKSRKAYCTYFKLSDATLDYHPDWPQLTELEATLRINNRGAFTEDAAGKVLDSDLFDASVAVPFPREDPADTILINAGVSGTVGDGIRVLNETPISDQISRTAENWAGLGSLRGRLSLDVGIGPRTQEPAESDVWITLTDAELTFPDYELTTRNVSGDLHYATETGLNAKTFTATVFNEPVAGFIGSDLTGDSGEIIINVRGAVDAADLYAWSGQSLLTRAAGKADYEVAVHIPFGGESDDPFIEATSDLIGIELLLPGTLAKRGDEQQFLYYRQEFLDPGFLIDLSMGDVQASLRVDDDVVTGGRIQLGAGAMVSTSYEQIDVTGVLANADYEEWDDLLGDLDTLATVALESELAEHIGQIRLNVDTLTLYTLALANAEVLITRGADRWDTQIVNELMAGRISLLDDDKQPLLVALDYLRFPESEEAADPMLELDPAELGDVDFTTAELRYGEENYGSWAFQFRPTETGALLENLSAQVKGLHVEPDASLVWTVGPEGHSSDFTGKVRADDLGLALAEWGYAASIEGSDFEFTADLDWVGSPAAIDLDIVRGQVDILQGKGRFVQAETGTGALKLLGIFDFAQIARRFRFDFSDVVKKGWSFNKVSGTIGLDQGLVEVREQVVIEGSSSIFKVGGSIDLNSQELDNDMVVTLPVSRNLPWYAAYSAIATGPLVGAGVMLAQKVFESQINQMSSARYKISGTVAAPRIEFVSIFDDTVRESAEHVAEDATGQ